MTKNGHGAIEKTAGDLQLRNLGYEDADLAVALEGKLLRFGYVARNKDGGGYFLTSQGTAAAFAPQLGTRTWVEIWLLTASTAVVFAILAVLGWHFFGPKTAVAAGVEPPVGSIIAWHKVLCDTGLPEWWVECNGPIGPSDPDYVKNSKIDLSKIPDLNNAHGYNGGRFLRGGTGSGTIQEDAVGPHKHQFDDTKHFVVRACPGGNREAPTTSGDCTIHHIQETGPVLKGGDETRPVNMSVVWIIRVK